MLVWRLIHGQLREMAARFTPVRKGNRAEKNRGAVKIFICCQGKLENRAAI